MSHDQEEGDGISDISGYEEGVIQHISLAFISGLQICLLRLLLYHNVLEGKLCKMARMFSGQK